MKSPGSTYRKVTFKDVTSSYIYVLFGFLAHLYIIFSGSLYFALEQEITHHLGATKETVVNYFAFLSIIFLLISLSFKWTRPIHIEEALIVLFIWILLRNLIPKDCVCCGNQHNKAIIDALAKEVGPTAAPQQQQQQQQQQNETSDESTKEAVVSSNREREKRDRGVDEDEDEEPACPWQNFNHLYSALCILVMISSFLMHARSYAVSLCFTVLSIALMIFTSLIPVSCNQLSAANANMNLLKFTLYSIVWFLNRRLRLSEYSLFLQYLKSMRIYYSYQDPNQQHLLCGIRHTTNKRRRCNNVGAYATPTSNRFRQYEDECDDIATFIEDNDECIVPRPLFENLTTLSKIVSKQKTTQSNLKKCKNSGPQGDKMRNFAWQSHQMLKIQEINAAYNAKRWFGNFFSWKNRFYDADVLNLFDLAKTLWILNVCPIYLLFVAFEYFLINYNISWNIVELQCLIERVKVMSHIRYASLNTCNSSDSFVVLSSASSIKRNK